jgi:hypothetical protein
MKKLFSWLGLWKAKGEVSQEAKDVVSASEIFRRDDLTEEEVAQARLKLDAAMKRLCNREE